jgi:hypothetical protein
MLISWPADAVGWFGQSDRDSQTTAGGDEQESSEAVDPEKARDDRAPGHAAEPMRGKRAAAWRAAEALRQDVARGAAESESGWRQIRQIGLAALGLVFVFVSVLLTEDEEKNLQTRLDSISAWIGGSQPKAFSAHVKLVRGAAARTHAFLTELLRDTRGYLGFCGLSFWMSHACFFIAAGIALAVAIAVDGELGIGLFIGGASCVVGTFAFLAGLVPIVHDWRTRWPIRIWRAGTAIVLLVLAASLVADLTTNPGHPSRPAVSSWACGVFLGIASDVACLFVVLWILKTASTSERSLVAVLLLAVTAMVQIAVAASPVLLSRAIPLFDEGAYRSEFVEDVSIFAIASNIPAVLVSSLWLGLIILLFVHRLLWPVIRRPMTALSRHRIFIDNRKFVFVVGVALIASSSDKLANLLRSLKP